MQTIYIDIYFFINFCVDILSLATAAKILNLHAGMLKLSAAAFVGATYAVFGILLSDFRYIMPFISIILFLLMIMIVTKSASIVRKIKFSFAFLTSEIIIGGLVYYGFCLLERIMEKFEIDTSGGENRNLLILSIIILLSYGVVKFLMVIFGGDSSLRVVRVCVGYNDKEESFDALVDSGNLAQDPASFAPVVFINEVLAKKITGENLSFEGDINKLSDNMRRKIRLIPVCRDGKRKILYGFLTDYVTVVNGGKYENISVTFAIDKKGDTYGGYPALMPAAALDNVF